MIDIETYLRVATRLAEFYTLDAEAASNLSIAADAYSSTAAPSGKVFDVRAAIDEMNRVSNRLQVGLIDESVKQFVRSLQKHASMVDGSPEGFLRREGRTAPADFAALCGECGVPLPDDVVNP